MEMEASLAACLLSVDVRSKYRDDDEQKGVETFGRRE